MKRRNVDILDKVKKLQRLCSSALEIGYANPATLRIVIDKMQKDLADFHTSAELYKHSLSATAAREEVATWPEWKKTGLGRKPSK